MPKNRMNRTLAAVSASVIAVIYAAGFIRTEAADRAIATAESDALAVTTAPVPAIASDAAVTSGSSAPTAYRNGTYNGTGTSSRGDVSVSLTVQNGRITQVSVTRATTDYPARLIGALPGQVVQRQSATVDLISGATFSALAFRGAVQQALAEAS